MSSWIQDAIDMGLEEPMTDDNYSDDMLEWAAGEAKAYSTIEPTTPPPAISDDDSWMNP